MSPEDLARIGGTEAFEYNWPWHALIESDSIGPCGGVLISKKHVLTAAHCVTTKLALFSDFFLSIIKLNLKNVIGRMELLFRSHRILLKFL